MERKSFIQNLREKHPHIRTHLFCINQAYEIAMGFYKEDTLDIEILENIEKKRKKIEGMK
jgi:hypothetical protein